MRRHIPMIALALLAIVMGRPAPARAQGAPLGERPAAYAVVVGSNPGGSGQEALRFAEEDARRVAELLRDLGGYRPEDVHLVVRPDPGQLTAAIAAVGAKVAADGAAGRQSVVFFYYSGHARATALNLGPHELPLTELREQLLALPTTLTVVVLDACQSGAFSRVKGAEPAADFSFNSLAKLDATGIAVLASSSASELSQESDILGSSYFTHHLLVGLRGAGDIDRDGRVSLDEAYKYAYDQTLLSTAATAVGTQHVSLEVDLKGRGQVALTYPQEARAQLELPVALEGQVLVQRGPAQSVVAELYKGRGATVRLALPVGRYRVLVRISRVLQRCDVALAEGEVAALRLDACDPIPQVETATKGPPGAPLALAAPFRPQWAFELSAGAGPPQHDDFTERLDDFGYDEGPVQGLLALDVTRSVAPHVHGLVQLSMLNGTDYSRATELRSLEFDWTAVALGAGARGELRLLRPLYAFAQASAGVELARTRFSDEGARVTKETFWGWHVAAAAGLRLQSSNGRGLFLRMSWVHAPAVDNLLGDTHDVGGRYVGVGLRIPF
jgi:caspase domain-containing protein